MMNYLINVYYVRYLFIVLGISLCMQFFYIYKLIPFNIDGYQLGFGFGSYIENLVEHGEFKSHCWKYFTNQEETCLRSSRMPALPLTLAPFVKLGLDQASIAFLKSTIFHLLTFIFFVFLIGKLTSQKQRFGAVTILALIYLSPMYSKHLTSITYEEGFIYWIFPQFFLCIVICSIDLLKKELPQTTREITWASLLAIGTTLFCFKSSMILLLGVCYTLIALLTFQGRMSRNLFLVLILSLLVIGFWGLHNFLESGRITLSSSWNGENLYRGNNFDGYKIYPDVSLDRLWDSELIRKSSGELISIKKQTSYTGFINEWYWNDYYKSLALQWAVENPIQWVKFFLKKFYVMFIGVEFTPHKVGALEHDNMTGPLKDLIVFVSLGLIRLLQIIFIFLSLHAVIYGQRENRLLVLVMFCSIAAYTIPYLIGFAYERHVSGLLPLLLIFNSFLWSRLKKINFLKLVSK